MQVAVTRRGERVVVPDATAAKLRRRGVTTSPLAFEPYLGGELDGRRLLVSRFGGGGDLLFISAVLRELKARHPGAEINVICDRRWHFLWTTNHDIRRFLDYQRQYTEGLVAGHDALLTFENVIEADPAPRENAYDLFFERAGLDPASLPAERKLPRWTPAAGDRKKARRLLRSLNPEGRPTVAVQWRASSSVRTYPSAETWAVCRTLVAAGCVVLLLGRERDLPSWARGRGVHRLAETGARLDTLAALVGEVDLLLGPDSFFVHLAAALDTPSVALYGPFSAESRVKYYPRCRALEATAECAPCFIHGHQPCPSAVGTAGRCWESLPAGVVASACLEVLDDAGERERREADAQAPA